MGFSWSVGKWMKISKICLSHCSFCSCIAYATVYSTFLHIEPSKLLYIFKLEVRKCWQKKQESPNSHVYNKSFVFFKNLKLFCEEEIMQHDCQKVSAAWKLRSHLSEQQAVRHKDQITYWAVSFCFTAAERQSCCLLLLVHVAFLPFLCRLRSFFKFRCCCFSFSKLQLFYLDLSGTDIHFYI